MKRILPALLFCLLLLSSFAGKVEKKYVVTGFRIESSGEYQLVLFDGCKSAGHPGAPSVPFHPVSLMLPPGEKAVSMEVTGSELTEVPGSFTLYPQQHVRPLSEGNDGQFIIDATAYASDKPYPSTPSGQLINATLNGFGFALSTFSPVVYLPAAGRLAYYRTVTVSITTEPVSTPEEVIQNIPSAQEALKRVQLFAQNPEMMERYPQKDRPLSAYEILIITTSSFQAGFSDLVNYYNNKGRIAQVATTESINSSVAGQDAAEKIRNYIKQQYQDNGIEHVILGGDVEYIPSRGFYCYVISGSGYEDFNIPADIYYSGLDGTWNSNNDGKWGEPGEDDLLPEISVGRMSFSDAQELSNMVHKSITYQSNPVPGELDRPFMVSEFLYDPPMTWGSDYLELLIGDHNDNGYFTRGIPEADNDITRLYDTVSYNWSVGALLEEINAGKSFIHHCGHSNSDYMMRLFTWDITDQNFSQVDGVSHNYQLMYTHGCICGAFDEDDCISEEATTMAKWLAGGVFNSRYGWFNQGTTEGPSAHLHREFISALYNPDPDSAIGALGMAHTMSKIRTAPWVGLPGEFEPGAQRWCHYDCNVLGDPAMVVWIDNPVVGIGPDDAAQRIRLIPNPGSDRTVLEFNATMGEQYSISLINALGQQVFQHDFTASQTGKNTHSIELGGFIPGFYHCLLKNGFSESASARLVIVR
jgi:hypothetical protein